METKKIYNLTFLVLILAIIVLIFCIFKNFDQQAADIAALKLENLKNIELLNDRLVKLKELNQKEDTINPLTAIVSNIPDAGSDSPNNLKNLFLVLISLVGLVTIGYYSAFYIPLLTKFASLSLVSIFYSNSTYYDFVEASSHAVVRVVITDETYISIFIKPEGFNNFIPLDIFFLKTDNFITLAVLPLFAANNVFI